MTVETSKSTIVEAARRLKLSDEVTRELLSALDNAASVISAKKTVETVYRCEAQRRNVLTASWGG